VAKRGRPKLPARRRRRLRPPERSREPINQVEIEGDLVELGALRHTPAGIPAVEFKIRHESEQEEAGSRRKVEAEIGAIAFAAQARLLAGSKLGAKARFKGFLGAKSKRSKKLVLHVTQIEFSEGA
jgi:primosomal replication protein N